MELDDIAQIEIARQFSPIYTRIDLTIPAQREMANRIREKLGLQSLSELGNRVVASEIEEFRPNEGEQ